MTEQPKKEYKLSDKQRLRAKEAKRRYRLKDKKCEAPTKSGKCGRQAYAEILATGQLVCVLHLVNPLKEELIRLNPPKPKEEAIISQSV